MPSIARRFLFAAALSLVLGIALGLWLLVRRELYGIWPTPYLRSAHVHLVMVGAVIEVISGVALWMFPRPLRDDTRPHQAWAEAGWWLIAPGTLLRAGAEAARSDGAAGVLPALVILGATMQVVGIVAVLMSLRSRVRPSGAGNRSRN